MTEIEDLLPAIQQMQQAISAAVVAACERQEVNDLSAVAADESGDTIYAIDKVGEAQLIEHLSAVAEAVPLILIAEGLDEGGVVLPRDTAPAEAKIRVLVDPIDGTRGLMFQKRPAWVLTGVAPNRGAQTRLRDIELAVQTEIPLIKQHQYDQLWASADGAVHGRRYNRLDGSAQALTVRPSAAQSLEHGFATFVRFFPGGRDALAMIDEQVMRETVGPQPAGKALCFEDQYACTGGQLYELMSGHDRMVADLRPLLADLLAQRGQEAALCCHPYDLCTMLIAERAGVVLTDPSGGALDAPMNLDADVAWAGYANQAIRQAVEPVLRQALEDHGLVKRD